MDEIKQQKIEMWLGKLDQLKKEYTVIIQRRGEAAREGDLRENAAYQMATQDAETWRVRIAEVRKILANLGYSEEENGKKEGVAQ